MRTYAERTISLPARSTRTSLPDLIILLRVSFWFTVITTKGSQRNNDRGREGGRKRRRERWKFLCMYSLRRTKQSNSKKMAVTYFIPQPLSYQLLCWPLYPPFFHKILPPISNPPDTILWKFLLTLLFSNRSLLTCNCEDGVRSGRPFVHASCCCRSIQSTWKWK